MRISGSALKGLLAAGIMALSLCPLALAGEIKIQDQAGLLRAEKQGPTPVSVMIELAGEEDHSGPAPLILVNVDGLAPDIGATLEAPGRYVFGGVKDGTWAVHTPPGLTLKKVYIAP